MIHWVNRKIGRKTFAIMLITVVLPILFVTGSYYYVTRKVVRDMMISESEQLFREGKKSFTNYFENINRASFFVYYNQVKEKSLSTVIDKEYDNDTENFILETMSIIRSYEEDIEQVYLYLTDIEHAYLLRSYMLVDQEIALSTSKESLLSTDKEVYIKPIHDISDYNLKHIVTYEREVVSFVRTIYQVPSKKIVGQVVIDLNANIFDELFENLYTKEEKLMLIDVKEKNIVYSTKTEEIGKKAKHDIMEEALQQINNGVHSFEWNKENENSMYIVDRITEQYMDYLLIKSVPMSTVYAELNNTLNVIGILLIFSILLAFAASSLNTILFTRPIHDLVSSIRKIREGDINRKVEVTNKDEYGELQVHFNNMMDAINEHIEQEYALQIENTKNELKALQSQINPHFLNNTLQSIGTEMLKEGNTKAYRLLVMLAGMMKYSMEHTSPIVKVIDEVEYSRNYLELQKNRFDDVFQYTIEVEEKVKEYVLPKMTLQPLIENYFMHGLDKERKDNEIYILITEVYEQIHIEICNNGKVASSEEIKKINEKIQMNQISDDTSIGITNVNRRLRLHFDNQARMYVDNQEGKGFKVDIYLRERRGHE